MTTLFDSFNQQKIDTLNQEQSIHYPPQKEVLSSKKSVLVFYRKFQKNNKVIGKRHQKQEKKADTNIQTLQQKIELLRLQLHQLANQKGFLDQSVIELSQKLDTYIVLYQRLVSPNKR
ncbi:MAG TPA: aspartyl-phosphate phosphatase Spo0E family protein [Candidatus Bathyarchaeia archaeon]|nr:aspartyl-phosphate phosphatase Spo0E family protein [Candidatus Bathyarchaeia archaeon]